jgi:hypothetical protein
VQIDFHFVDSHFETLPWGSAALVVVIGALATLWFFLRKRRGPTN